MTDQAAHRHQLGTELVKLDSVRPHPRNARRHDSRDQVDESLDEHGQYRAIVVQQSTGHVIAGNGLYARLRERGDDEVWVQWLDVDDHTALRILLVDNATSDASGFYDEQLAALLQEVETLAGTGYSEQDLDDLLHLVAGAMSPDELLEQYPDTPSERDLWPMVRVRVPRHIEERWRQLVARNDGDEAAAFEVALDAAGA